MFKIDFSPQVRADYLVVGKQGEALVINRKRYDFSQLPEGATLPREAMDCEFFASDVTRKGGDIELTLLLPITANASAAARNPETILVSADGAIHVPE